MPEIEFFQLTDVGCVREGNEDAVGHWPHEDGLLIAVADGLGGHAAGEVASALALEVLAREMDRAPGSWALTKRLRRAVQEANLELYNKAIVVPELRGMGTTLTASAVVGGTLVAAVALAAGCGAVVGRAREEGGEDNVSVQVAAIVSCPPGAARPWWRLGR